MSIYHRFTTDKGQDRRCCTLQKTTMPSTANMCDSVTRAGLPCRKKAMAGSAYCHCHTEKPDEVRCIAVTKSGERCKLGQVPGCLVCHVHGGVRSASEGGAAEGDAAEESPEVSELSRKIGALEVELRRLREERARLRKAKGELRYGRMAFYHAMKAEVLDNSQLKERLAAVGLLNGRVHWSMVKAVTDSMFERLTDTDKAVWVGIRSAAKQSAKECKGSGKKAPASDSPSAMVVVV